ncbi:MAG: tyrosine-protein phosphatase [Acidimicrobiales bacterium]
MSDASEWAGEVPGAFNLRDLGGNPVEGGIVAPGRVYRCDLLHRVDAELGAAWLHDHDVRTLIDLRTEGERQGDGFMAASAHLDARHRGLLDEVWSWEAENKAADEWFLRDRTIEMYERFPDRIARVLQDIAEAPANVLFHCTAGKDRTGVIASALLGVLGASPEVIVADYARSTDAMPAIIGWYRDQDLPEGVDRPERDHAREQQIIERAAAPSTMAGVVDVILARHGSFAGWARDSGIGDQLVEALRRKLVVPAPTTDDR